MRETSGPERLVRRLYGRSWQWFARTYGYQRSPLPFPYLLGDTGLSTPGQVGLIAGGPCLDHAVDTGPTMVSFQVAVEAALILAAARQLRCPLALFVIAGSGRYDAQQRFWDDVLDRYKALISAIAASIGLASGEIRFLPSWQDGDIWRAHLARLRPLDCDPLFTTMYHPAESVDSMHIRTVPKWLRDAYYVNLQAYNPDLIRDLVGSTASTVLHLENLHQARAFHASRRFLGFAPNSSVHGAYLPMPTADGRQRLTRGDSVLTAGMGMDQMLEMISQSEIQTRYLETHAALPLPLLVRLFVDSFS